MIFHLEPELRKYLEYVRDSYLQLNTNNTVVNIGSRGEILDDAIKDLSDILDDKDMPKFPELIWKEGYTN